MKINNGEIIKKIRKDTGLSREEFADILHITHKQMSRIESGIADIDIWQFMSILELLGRPTEDFWLLYLSCEEYDIYKKYRELKRLLGNNLLGEATAMFSEFGESILSEQTFIGQFLAYIKILIDKDITHQKVIDKLFIAMRISNPDFNENETAEYRMTYNELCIAIEIADRMNKIGEYDRSEVFIKKLTENMERFRISEEDKAVLFPLLMLNFCTNLCESEKFQEALEICNKAEEISMAYDNFKYIPRILHNIATCYKELGEDEQVYKPYLVRAYHFAHTIGDNKEANIIKNNAKESFNIVLV